MADATTAPPPHPTHRSDLLSPPDGLRLLRDESPVSEITYPGGTAGWLVTSYAAARTVLADRRFSVRNELRQFPVRSAETELKGQPAAPGWFIAMDPPDHTRLRRPLIAQFTMSRMRALSSKIEEITSGLLDEMAEHGPPVDLVEAFAKPIPSLMICEMLGVPYSEREQFQQNTETMTSFTSKPEELVAAYQEYYSFMDRLKDRKRADPADDILSGLIAADELSDAELIGVGLLLLSAGYEPPANMLSLGAYALLRHPAQLATLRTDPSLIDTAVEELLRYLSVLQYGVIRAALEDVELEGRLIRAGDPVTISLPAANRDPGRFEDPDTLDVTRRSATAQMAFGHGIHQCLGQQLARRQLRIGLSMLLDRFPGLRLAAPVEEIPMRDDMRVYGVRELPVAW
ncbi:cytochrome P450 [Actinomadura napierensis]|uniref:Cytochrome P450 n=1 Tax=Actinomadura napierensis TaxID=267854 RepID=A0ABP5KH42_9ACTN